MSGDHNMHCSANQPDALRLADAMDLYATGDKHQRDIEQAAAELRRLYELAESEGRWASDYLKRAVKAEALNAQLLEALEAMLAWTHPAWSATSDKARAAIEAAKEQYFNNGKNL